MIVEVTLKVVNMFKFPESSVLNNLIRAFDLYKFVVKK